METSVIVSIVFGILDLIILIGGGYFAFIRGTDKKFAEHDERLTRLDSQMEVFWKVLDPHLARIIHSPVHVERDALVDKLITNEITTEELVELDMRLKAMIGEESGDKQIAAILLQASVQTKLLRRCPCALRLSAAR